MARFSKSTAYHEAGHAVAAIGLGRVADELFSDQLDRVRLPEDAPVVAAIQRHVKDCTTQQAVDILLRFLADAFEPIDTVIDAARIVPGEGYLGRVIQQKGLEETFTFMLDQIKAEREIVISMAGPIAQKKFSARSVRSYEAARD